MDIIQPLAERFLEAYEGAVKLIVFELFINVGDSADVNDHVGGGIDLFERGQDCRQPAAGDTGVCPKAQRRAAALTQAGGVVLQRNGGVEKRLHPGLQCLTGRGEAHAVLAAHQEVQTELLLQRVHHMCQA